MFASARSTPHSVSSADRHWWMTGRVGWQLGNPFVFSFLNLLLAYRLRIAHDTPPVRWLQGFSSIAFFF